MKSGLGWLYKGCGTLSIESGACMQSTLLLGCSRHTSLPCTVWHQPSYARGIWGVVVKHGHGNKARTLVCG